MSAHRTRTKLVATLGPASSDSGDGYRPPAGAACELVAGVESAPLRLGRADAAQRAG